MTLPGLPVLTAAHNLPAKFVVHAVGPTLSGQTPTVSVFTSVSRPAFVRFDVCLGENQCRLLSSISIISGSSQCMCVVFVSLSRSVHQMEETVLLEDTFKSSLELGLLSEECYGRILAQGEELNGRGTCSSHEAGTWVHRVSCRWLWPLRLSE